MSIRNLQIMLDSAVKLEFVVMLSLGTRREGDVLYSVMYRYALLLKSWVWEVLGEKAEAGILAREWDAESTPTAPSCHPTLSKTLSTSPSRDRRINCTSVMSTAIMSYIWRGFERPHWPH
jgi:hypothetical protein